MALPKVDALIVGLGAAGGVMAKELATAGMKVVGLDLGPFRRTIDFQYHDELRFTTRKELLQPKISETPMMLRPNAQASAVPSQPWTISVGVGGGSVHYSAWLFRMLPHHFKIRSDVVARYGASALPDGSNIVDWPITYDDPAPYYDKVEVEIGISGKAGNIKGQVQAGGNPFEGPRSGEYPLPPLLTGTGGRIYATTAKAMGYKPFPTPAGLISQDYDGRPGCNYCGFCGTYGCHVGAKSSTLVSVIPKALATGNLEIRPNCRAIRVNTSGGLATSVTYWDPAGVEQEQPASLIILSNYTWEIVRVLLMSGINKNGMVGKYLMSHHSPSVVGFSDTIAFNPSVGPSGASTTVDEFNGDNFDHTGLGFIEGASLVGASGSVQAIGGVARVTADTPVWGAAYKSFIKQYFERTAGLAAQLPSLPYEANFLDLDPAKKDALGLPVIRITYDGYDNEKKVGAFLQDKQEAILRQMGCTKILRGPLTSPPFNNHEVGVCRMGDDPTKAVVNRYCESHELPNMFIVSGAVFPTYFGYNPTNTIFAISYWSANYIKAQTKAGGSLAKYM